MTRFDRQVRLGAVALATLVAMAAVRSPAAPGWTFTWKVTGDGPGQNMTAQIRVLEQRLRMDFEEGSMPGLSAGGYMLFDATKGQMIMVSPQEKSAMIMSGEGMASAMDAMGGMKMDVTDASTTVEPLGPGGEILGLPTQRYRVRQSFTITVSAMGQSQSSTMQNDIETWMTTALPAEQQQAFEAFERNFMRSTSNMAAMGGEVFKKLADELQAKMPKGFALKQVQTSTTTMSGQTSTSKATMEVTSMATADLDPSLFEVPADYRVQDMSQLMRQMKRPPE